MTVIKSRDFGERLYNKLPPKYKEDDVRQNLALKRYFDATTEGGFNYVVDELNGITKLVDPLNVDAKVLPILLRQYGLEVFNGIPEQYLRYLVPKLGDVWASKGSLSAIEFITSSVSGIKTVTNVTYDENNNPLVDVKLEMDYSMGDYVPEVTQLNRLLENFLPFYCDTILIHSYKFYDDFDLKGEEVILNTVQIHPVEETGEIYSYDDSAEIIEIKLVDSKIEAQTYTTPKDTFLNIGQCTLNNGFYLNGIYNYDKITQGGKTTTVVPLETAIVVL